MATVLVACAPLLSILVPPAARAAVNQPPSVAITCPFPSDFVERVTDTTTTITWTGSDPDGFFATRPVQYRYRLLSNGTTPLSIWIANPDSLRRSAIATGYAGWDSCLGESTHVTLRHLVPNNDYLFVVTAFDEMGDATTNFTLSSNMLHFQAWSNGLGALGPVITISGLGATYRPPMPSWSLDPSVVLRLEAPADQPIRLDVGAESYSLGDFEGLRWMLDGDPHDSTTRTTPGDTRHWSAWSLDGALTLGPFVTNGVKHAEHMLYLEASATSCSGPVHYVSLLPVQLIVERPTFSHELLVVDDTRLEVDQSDGEGGVLPYAQAWPSAAELDTFLYARGGVPWHGTQSSGFPASRPGVLAGYAFDTLGTRGLFTGQVLYGEQMNSVPLSVLLDYRHVIWMTDLYSGINGGTPTSPNDPIGTRHDMCRPGRQDVLAIYMAMGGEVWTLGGMTAYASLVEYNAHGSRQNDFDYGPGQTVFSSTAGELVAGRPMFDVAHWRSELVVQNATSSVRRAGRADSLDLLPATQWYGQGWKYAHPDPKPHYGALPSLMRTRSLALGDSLPPTRASYQSGTFYTGAASNPVEYLTRPNAIVEDANPDPLVTDPLSTLDTLMVLSGGALAASGNDSVCMTYYHGPGSASYVHSGFPVWAYSRQDVTAMFDFVLQQVWGLPRQAVDRCLSPETPGAATTPAGATAAPMLRR